MRVIVLGAGVVGVTSAWFLAKAGHAVTVVERQPGAGLETSFANGGQISASHAEPWANPHTPGKALRWLGREDAPLVLRWRRLDPALWAWGLRFLLNCTSGRTAVNTERILRVAMFSRRVLQQVRGETGIEYEQRTQGILHIYRDRREFDQAVAAADVMRRHGLVRDVKGAAQCVDIEPALAQVRDQLAGGLFSPEDESGDAHKFTTRLAALAADAGVDFRFGTPILGLKAERGRITGVATGEGTLTADAYLLCLGSYSPLLARQVGLRLPIYPAKGYSATVAVENPAAAPSVSITDDEYKMVYSRLGERLRIAGTAELAGHDRSLNPVRSRALVDRARALFPEAGDYDRAELWAGLRPVTPDSVPLIGSTPLGNLYLNTGHGTLGWTMSCGSGRLIAQIISGQAPDIDIRGLGLDRF